MSEINEGFICVVKNMDGYRFVPSCMLGYASGSKPNRD
jgi:hypothetical protein